MMDSRVQHVRVPRWRRIWPLVALCFLVASRWFVEGGLPSMGITVLTQSVGCLLAAGIFFLPAGRFSDASKKDASKQEAFAPRSGVVAPRATVIGVVSQSTVLTAPALCKLLAGRHLNANDATLALSLTPVVVAVVTVAIGDDGQGDLTGRLWPGLAGLAGLLLLLPQPALEDARFSAALVCLPLLMGIAAAMSRSREPETKKIERAIVSNEGFALLLASATFAALTALGPSGTAAHFSFGAAAYDGSVAGLTLLVLRRLGATRWSAQFILIPLLSLLEGAAILRPLLDGRSWLGLGLLAASSVFLLL